tara:strand:- start:87 stop:455 length:369 start_codon:yes stop_codon:yes gene_type:complete
MSFTYGDAPKQESVEYWIDMAQKLWPTLSEKKKALAKAQSLALEKAKAQHTQLPRIAALKQLIREETRERLSKMLKELGTEQTAKKLKIAVNTLYSHMKNLGIEKTGKKGKSGRKKKEINLN